MDGVIVALEQFQTIDPELDTSSFNPFKIVVGGKIVDE